MSEASAVDPAAIREAVQGRVLSIQAEDKAALVRFMFEDCDDMDAPPAPPDWLIRGYLDSNTLAVLFGESGSMKSFVALDMAFSLATGKEWHGVKVSKPGPVAYIAAEGGQGLNKRKRAWRVAHGIKGKVPLCTLSQPVQFLSAQDVEDVKGGLDDVVKRHGPLRLVIIDTLARCFADGDENLAKDMTHFVAALDDLRLRYGCTILVVHHSGLSAQDRARGSSVLRAALDWEYCLEKQEETRVLRCKKAKDYEEAPAVAFEPEQVPTGWIDPEDGSEIVSCVLCKVEQQFSGKRKPLTGGKRVAFDSLKGLYASGGRVHEDAWRDEAKRKGISAGGDRAKNKAFRTAISGLLDMGIVDVSDDYYWPVDGQKEPKEPSGNSSLRFFGKFEEPKEHTSIGSVPCSSSLFPGEVPKEKRLGGAI